MPFGNFVATCSYRNGVELSETNSRHRSHGYLLFYEQLQYSCGSLSVLGEMGRFSQWRKCRGKEMLCRNTETL